VATASHDTNKKRPDEEELSKRADHDRKRQHRQSKKKSVSFEKSLPSNPGKRQSAS